MEENNTAATPQEGASTENKDAKNSSPEVDVNSLKSEIEALKQELKQARDLQAQADKKARMSAIERKKLEKQIKALQSGEVIPETTPEEQGATAEEREILLKARIGIQNLILDKPEYQELLKKDPTLKIVLKNNPFALIGEEWADEEDIVSQIKERLDERVSSMAETSSPKVDEKKEEPEPAMVNPSENVTKPQEEEKPKTLEQKLSEKISRSLSAR